MWLKELNKNRLLLSQSSPAFASVLEQWIAGEQIAARMYFVESAVMFLITLIMNPYGAHDGAVKGYSLDTKMNDGGHVVTLPSRPGEMVIFVRSMGFDKIWQRKYSGRLSARKALGLSNANECLGASIFD